MIEYRRFKTRIYKNESEIGESIETKLRKIFEEKEPITQQFERIYTNRKDGVLPEFNIRTDRFEIARVAKEKLNRYEAQKLAKAEEKRNQIIEAGKQEN